MESTLKNIPLIDAFILLITGDRLSNSNLIENMTTYQTLFGGRMVWDNIILVIPK